MKNVKGVVCSFISTFVLGIIFIFLSQNIVFAASGGIKGQIIDQTGNEISGAVISLTNPVSGYSKQVTSTDDGSFVFYNVPYSSYQISAKKDNFKAITTNVDVRSALVVEIKLVLSVADVQDVIVVKESDKYLLETDSATTHIDIDKSLIKHFPASSTLRGIESIIISAPGFIADANGRFHFRGSHGQITYVVDGVPISDQMNLAYSNSLDPSNIESMEVITGGMLPEYGGRNAAVVNLATRSALDSDRKLFGNISLNGARFSTGEIGAQVGGSFTRKFGYFINLGSMRSNRFSDPVNFENLNNTGNMQRASIRLDFAPTQRDFFKLSIGGSRTERDIPNLFSQHLVGQSQISLTKDASVNLSWQHTFGSKALAEIAPYFRTSTAQFLERTPFSTPLSIQQDRHLSNYGVIANVSYDDDFANIHNHFKTGFSASAFPISENFNFAITDSGYNVPSDDPETYNPNLLKYDLTRGGSRFQFMDQRTGKQYAFYIQDMMTYRGFTVSGGLRFDNYRFVVKENGLQPRLGLSYYIARTGTVLRASYNRLFLPPFSENLLLASSNLGATLVPPFVVQAQGIPLSPVKAERQNAYEIGIQQKIKNWFRIDFAYWTKDAKQASDNSQFLNTGINFPVAFTSSKLRGFDFRLDIPEHYGFSSYWSIGNAKAIYNPPFTGGLFLDPEVAAQVTGTPFRIDHDQKISSQFMLQYTQRKRGWWVALMNRYDSGLVTEIEDVNGVAANPDIAFGLRFVDLGSDPQRVKSRSVWNASVGYELFQNEIYKVELQTHLLNFTNNIGLYNFLSTFGGTQVIPPRTYAVRLKFNF